MQRVLALAAGVLSGCILWGSSLPEMHRRSVTKRASYDFQCGEQEIAVKDVGGNAYAAEGCGQTQVYNCSGNSDTCVREGGQPPDDEPAATPAPVPPPP